MLFKTSVCRDSEMSVGTVSFGHAHQKSECHNRVFIRRGPLRICKLGSPALSCRVTYTLKGDLNNCEP